MCLIFWEERLVPDVSLRSLALDTESTLWGREGARLCSRLRRSSRSWPAPAPRKEPRFLLDSSIPKVSFPFVFSDVVSTMERAFTEKSADALYARVAYRANRFGPRVYPRHRRVHSQDSKTQQHSPLNRYCRWTLAIATPNMMGTSARYVRTFSDSPESETRAQFPLENHARRRGKRRRLVFFLKGMDRSRSFGRRRAELAPRITTASAAVEMGSACSRNVCF